MSKFSIKYVYSELSVIYLAFTGNEYEAVKALEIGVDIYTVKPVQPFELIAYVRSLLRQRESSENQ